MSSESDNIEAKLAAYIDGQLGESERAEIEKYLANNPQQAQVMRELMQGREWMRELPRESAPPEIMEAIQTSLERGQLLARPVEEEASGGGWWRQVVAIAAILVLAVGLAGLVYWVTHPPGIPKYSTAEMMPSKPIPATDEAANSAVSPLVNTGATTRESGEIAGNAGPVASGGPGFAIAPSAPVTQSVESALADGGRTGDVSQQFGNSVTADQNAPALTLSQVPSAQVAPSAAPSASSTPGQEAQVSNSLALNTNALNTNALNTNGPAQNNAVQNAFTQDLLTGGAPVNFYTQNANARSAPAQTVMVTRDVERARTRVTDYFARNNIAYEFSAMPANQNAQVNGLSQMNGVSQTLSNSLAFQQVAQNSDRSRALVQNQMIIARRVPADKVSEITQAISGKPLVLKAMDRAEVQERRLVAEKSNVAVGAVAAPTSGPVAAPGTQSTFAGALVNASQPALEGVDLRIVFCVEPTTAPVELPAIAKESVEQEPAKDATSKPAPPVWLKTKAGIQYEK